MIIVADSSPFIVLLDIGRIEILPDLLGAVIIPPEVAAELGSSRRSEQVRAFITTPPGWLTISAPASIEVISGLHAGEMAAISLARELQADRLIIDEASGRRTATARNLPIIGTIGILELAAERRLLDLASVFERLKETDFWVSPRFLNERLSRFYQRVRTSEHEPNSEQK